MLMAQTHPIRILDTGKASAAYNMSFDHAVFSCSEKSVIRFYDWDRNSISLGYAQKQGEVLDASCCRDNGVDVVKRPTGGGVVFHGEDITFSVFMSAGLAKRDDVLILYKALGRCISESLQHFGLKADIADNSNIDIKEQFCMCQVSKSDVIVGGKKIAGGAIKWSRKGTLYQGYIQLNNNEGWAGDCLSPFLKAVYSPFDRWATSVRQEISWGFNQRIFKDVLAEKITLLLHGQYETGAVSEEIYNIAQLNSDKYLLKDQQ